MKRINFNTSAPEGAKAMHAVHDYVANCGLPMALIDLVYLRVSQINGCAFCIDMHTRDLLKNGVPAEKITLVPVWHEAKALFTPREQAALHWAESLTNVSTTHAPDSAYAAVSTEFEGKELADLTLAIALMNALNRFGIGFRIPPQAIQKGKA